MKVLLSCQKLQLMIALSVVDFMALSRHVLSTIKFWFVDYMHIFVSFAVDEQVHTPVAHTEPYLIEEEEPEELELSAASPIIYFASVSVTI